VKKLEELEKTETCGGLEAALLGNESALRNPGDDDEDDEDVDASAATEEGDMDTASSRK